MIFNAPSGLYTPILPVSPSDPGNITFTISNNNPPRSGTTFIRLPPSEELKPVPDRVYTKLEKRQFYSDLIYNITTSGPSDSDSGSSQFEIGEVLDFTEDDAQEADPYQLESILLQQNTKVPDFEVAGISQEDYNAIVRASEAKIEELTLFIRQVSTSLKNNGSLISKNQASINQSTALLENTIVVLGEEDPITVKIKTNIEGLEIEKGTLLESRSALQSRLDALRDELQKVREAVR